MRINGVKVPERIAVTFRLYPETHDKATEFAKKTGLSLNEALNRLVTAGIQSDGRSEASSA